MIKFTAKAKDDTTLIGLGFQKGNFSRMYDDNDPVVVIGEEINVPKTDLIFFAGPTDDEITERMQPMLEAALGESKDGDVLPAAKIAGQYFVLPVAAPNGRMAYFFGFNQQVMRWLESGGIQDIRIRPCDKDGKPLPGGVRIMPFYTDNAVKTEQQMIMGGLIGPGTQWSRYQEKQDNDYSEKMRKWKASLN